MRLISVFLIAFTLSSCARIAVLKEITPVFRPDGTVKVDIDSHARAFREASNFEKTDPWRAGEYYIAALAELTAKLQKQPDSVGLQQAYNYALDRMFSLIRMHNLNPWGTPLRFGKYQFTSDKVPIEGWRPANFEFLPTDQVEVGGEYLTSMAVRRGLGASLVAIGREPKPDYRRTFSQPRAYYGVSAIARFRGNVCTVSFYDPMDDETVSLGQHRFTLAADYTTPLAVLLTRERPEKLGLVRLLDPAKYAETARISRLRPYDPDRIPLLLVHGLLDTPATWVPMVNELRADPLVRQHFQIWVFSYPSGYPYPYSAALLRKELDRMKEVYPRHKPIVVVGHSMGGMISRLLVTDSRERLWDAYFHQPPEAIRMSEREKQLMMDMLIFKARPEISRAIFIAAPHRGSRLAATFPARLARRLVRVPQMMVELGDAIRQVVTLSEGGMAYEDLPTSIDSLTTTNTFVKTVDSLPIKSRIPYHSIMGDRGKPAAQLNPELGTDTYVPYTSSHLPGAVSELIIPSDHSAHQHPEGIAEVRRILRMHVGKGGPVKPRQPALP